MISDDDADNAKKDEIREKASFSEAPEASAADASDQEEIPTERGIPAKQQSIAAETLERVKSTEVWMIALTSVIAIASLITAWVYWQQLDVMRDTLNEIRTGGVDTHALVLAQSKQARAMTESIGPASKLSAESAATASGVNQHLLDTAREQLRINEEPVLTHQGVVSARNDHRLYVGEKVPVYVLFKNTGRGAAYDVHLWTASAHGRGALSTVVQSAARSQEPLVVGAGDPLWSAVEIPSISSTDIEDIKAGTLHIWVLSMGYYRDRSGHKISMESCDVIDPAIDSFSTCSEPHHLVVVPPQSK